jgi:hypothetical protein
VAAEEYPVGLETERICGDGHPRCAHPSDELPPTDFQARARSIATSAPRLSRSR